MRVIDRADAGIHYQKSELRNDYNDILKRVEKEGKLFIDDRNSQSVAVMISYGFYKELLEIMGQIEELQDQIDYQKALTRESQKAKPISSERFKELIQRMKK